MYGQDHGDDDLWEGYMESFWTPEQHDGWTWVKTDGPWPEYWSLFDADGEMMGCVRERNSLICWAPFVWGEEVYQAPNPRVFVNEGKPWNYVPETDAARREQARQRREAEAQRLDNFAKLGAALHDWERRPRPLPSTAGRRNGPTGGVRRVTGSGMRPGSCAARSQVPAGNTTLERLRAID